MSDHNNDDGLAALEEALAVADPNDPDYFRSALVEALVTPVTKSEKEAAWIKDSLSVMKKPLNTMFTAMYDSRGMKGPKPTDMVDEDADPSIVAPDAELIKLPMVSTSHSLDTKEEKE